MTTDQEFVFDLIKQCGMRRLVHALPKEDIRIFEEVQQTFGETFGERVYCYVHGLKKRPLCDNCHKEPVTRFRSYYKGYGFVCSNRCAGSHPAHLLKRKRTSLERYGVDSPAKSPEVEQKRKLTMMKRHGTQKPVKVRWRDGKKN